MSVDVPAGIADGQRIRVTGRGHAGERGGPPGDLYVLVRVDDDDRFVRDGDDLLTAVDVSAPQAALGTTIEVPTLDGPTDLEIPAGTQPNETFVLRGRGMPSLRGRRHGDLQVVVNVVIPRRSDRRATRADGAARGVAYRREPPLRRGRVREAAARFRRLTRAGACRAAAGGAGAPRRGRAGAGGAARAGAERCRGGRRRRRDRRVRGLRHAGRAA